MRSPMKRGFTLIELLVVIAIIAILASILFPVFAKARAKARQTQCNSNVRQISLAVQMYAQDNNGQYPGIDGGSWVNKVAPYLGNSGQMFMCPEDTTKDSGAVSYGFAGILIRKDGSGVKEANVLSPSEVGCLADAAPSETYPNGRLIGGGANAAVATNGATIETRHSKGAIVGYCDGHAKYFQGAVNEQDLNNGAVRALIAAQSLGLVDNPLGNLWDGATVSSGTGVLTVGGEFAAYPLLMGAAQFYGNYYTSGFRGQSYTQGRPSGNWAWGGVTAGVSDADPGSAVAYDALCIIVSKGCKIPGAGSKSNETYAMTTAKMRSLFSTGYEANTVQVYKLSESFSQTTAQIKNVLCSTSGVALANFGTDPVEVNNDLEMVDKVCNDPYAIGYCSSIYADPERVCVVAIKRNDSDAAPFTWPRISKKFRWVLPTTLSELVWPEAMQRKITISSSAGDVGADVKASLETGTFRSTISNGPLYKTGYIPGMW